MGIACDFGSAAFFSFSDFSAAALASYLSLPAGAGSSTFGVGSAWSRGSRW